MSTSTPAHERFQAALSAHQCGDLQVAERGYRDALLLDPNHTSSYNNLGLIQATTDRIGAAIDSFERALKSNPQSLDASVNLAQALQHTERYAQALQQWRHASSLSPRQMEPALAGALLAMQMGELQAAMELLENAARGEPDGDGARATLIDAASQLGATRLDAGALGDAHRMARLLSRIDPGGDTAPRMLERCLRNAQLREFDESIRDDVLICYRSDAVDHRQLARISAQLLLARYPLLSTDLVRSPVLQAVEAQQVHRDPLLLALLNRSINTHPLLECALTGLRSELLSAYLRDESLDEAWLVFSAALAMQCFANDYVYTESEADSAQVRTLEALLKDAPDNWPALAVLTSYRATYRLEFAASINAICARAPLWIAPLLQRTLLEPITERQLRETIAEAAPRDSTSRRVQSQYEESPYPRWQNLEQQIPITIDAYLREEIPHFTPAAIFEQAADILIAGCGTGEHALRVATRHPQCRVQAIDLSRASLAYAQRKAQQLKTRNIEFEHGDILELRFDKRRYALIESVGVIHHMRDPAAGLAALCARLASGGVIKLGLYSRAARAQVNAARARIRELGLDTSEQSMRHFRERILNGQEAHLRRLCESQDFYTLNTVRDLLFHVQEHQYDTEELRALLTANDLHVIGFQVAAGTRRLYQQRFADDPALVNLEHWGQFEQESPNTFAGMYQFWCQSAKSDCRESSDRIR